MLAVEGLEPTCTPVHHLLDDGSFAITVPGDGILAGMVVAAGSDGVQAVLEMTDYAPLPLREPVRSLVWIRGRLYGVVDSEVAAFVGVETIVPGRIREVSSGLASIIVGENTIEATTELPPGSDVLVCLRPEDVTVSGLADATLMSARNRLRVAVTRVRPAGPYVRMELDAGFNLVAHITKQSLEELAISPGANAIASFKATAVHLIPHRPG